GEGWADPVGRGLADAMAGGPQARRVGKGRAPASPLAGDDAKSVAALPGRLFVSGFQESWRSGSGCESVVRRPRVSISGCGSSRRSGRIHRFHSSQVLVSMTDDIDSGDSSQPRKAGFFARFQKNRDNGAVAD